LAGVTPLTPNPSRLTEARPAAAV